ncbi:hypothetical protein ACIRG5_25445 [Lentzea sp. NPDC102401]|uniref:hypothetical protein n=1 Tax=Lentzea sp. NPDC102401 TaxID=3364128 RepID=UPI003815175D
MGELMSVTAAWGPLSFRFDSPDETELAWVDAHLHVSTLSSSLLRRFAGVQSVRDDEQLGFLAARPSERRQVRIRDTWYRDVDGGRAWVTEQSGDLPAHAFVRHAHDRWSVVTAGGRRTPRLPEILLRALIVDELVRAGGVTLHAAAATNPSGTTVFCGDGGVGKSTLAVWFARSGGQLIAGDRTVVLPGGTAVGAAIAPRFGWGTVAALGATGRVRTARLVRPDAVRADKVVLTQREIGDLIGVGTADAAEVDAFVHVVREPGPPVVERVSAREAPALLLRHRVPADAGWTAERDEAGHAFGLLAAARPVFRLRWDPRSHAAEDALARLREAR